jgi:hypothetical protein
MFSQSCASSWLSPALPANTVRHRRAAVQSNKVYLPRMSPSQFASIASRQRYSIPALGERQLSGNSIAFPQEAGHSGLNGALGNHSRHRHPASLVRA